MYRQCAKVIIKRRKGRVIVQKKNRSGFVPGFLIGMLSMFIMVAGIGAGIYLSDTGITSSKNDVAVSKAEKN